MILEHILLHDAEHIDEKEKLENARKLLFWAGYYLANAKPNHAVNRARTDLAIATESAREAFAMSVFDGYVARTPDLFSI